MTDQSILIILGLAYAAAGFGALISPSSYMKVAGERSSFTVLLIIKAFFLFLGGGYLIATHRFMWIADIPTLVALIGWAAVIKGGFMLAFPDISTSIARKAVGKEWVVVLLSALVFGFGLTLTYVGLYVR